MEPMKTVNKKPIIITAAIVAVVCIMAAVVIFAQGGSTEKRLAEQLDLAERYLSELDYEQAIAAYEAAIEIDPKCEDAYLGLADAYIGLGDYESAVETLKTGIEETGSERLTECLAEIHPDHTWEDATCTEAKYCSVCGETDGEALGHIWAEGTCTVCGEISPNESNTEVAEAESSSGEVTDQSVGSEWNPAEDFEYAYDEELGGIRINKYIGRSTVVYIPAEIDGVPVKSISGFKYFDNNNNVYCIVPVFQDGITEVTIPDSVAIIGEYAFCWCQDLTKITIPDSVTAIGEYAFSWCQDLTKITIPDSVTAIGEGAFGECVGLTEVTIPGSVIYIGYCAFVNCTGLTEVTILDGVTEIGEGAFGGCVGLTEVTIPDSCIDRSEFFGDGAFYGCPNFTVIYQGQSYTIDDFYEYARKHG